MQVLTVQGKVNVLHFPEMELLQIPVELGDGNCTFEPNSVKTESLWEPGKNLSYTVL